MRQFVYNVRRSLVLFDDRLPHRHVGDDVTGGSRDLPPPRPRLATQLSYCHTLGDDGRDIDPDTTRGVLDNG